MGRPGVALPGPPFADKIVPSSFLLICRQKRLFELNLLLIPYP